QLFGLAARITTPGVGQTTGYLFTYDRGNPNDPTDGDMDIIRIDGEQPATNPEIDDLKFAGNDDIHLETGHSYRFVFMGVGAILRGQVYDLTVDPNTAVVDYYTYDPNYNPNGSDHVSGKTGLIVANNASPTYDGPAD